MIAVTCDRCGYQQTEREDGKIEMHQRIITVEYTHGQKKQHDLCPRCYEEYQQLQKQLGERDKYELRQFMLRGV